MATGTDPLAHPTYVAQLHAIRTLADDALAAGTVAACEEALDAIADIACDVHDDDDDDQ